MRPAPAAGSIEALTLLREVAEQGDPFSLVVTDVHMPEVDGFDLVTRIRSSSSLPKAVIMMLASAEHRTDVARCRELGVAQFLTKPVRHAELRAASVRALAGRTGGSNLNGSDRRCRPP